jgi:hypothetical protein
MVLIKIGKFIKFFKFIILSISLLLSSCITYNYDHIIEKFIEFKDIDFNHIRIIHIVCTQKDFSNELKNFILVSYRNRGITEPEISVNDKINDGLDSELNFLVNKNDYSIGTSWSINPEKNKIIYSKTITSDIIINVFKTNEEEKKIDLADKVVFTIQEEITVPEYLKISRENTETKYKELAEKGLKKIDNNLLFYGLADKMLHGFLAKRLKPISRELIRFKAGFNLDLFKAQKFLKEDKLEDALIIWEQIYSDPDKSSYSRSIAAYNIGMVNAIRGDYENASIYFNRSEELEEQSSRDLFRF